VKPEPAMNRLIPLTHHGSVVASLGSVKRRLDVVLVERGLAQSRSQAQALVLAGLVKGHSKPGEQVSEDVELEVEQPPRFVSRGGDKLQNALAAFHIAVAGHDCADVGASTGGFTDCLLQRGASRVYALDVGRGQLAETLRNDPRVISMERTHASRLDPAAPDPVTLPEMVSLAVADVSFISLTKVLHAIAHWIEPGGAIVPLVKPQFELEPADVPRGVVRDPARRADAVARVRDHASRLGLTCLAEVESPLVGPSGNHEFFLHLRSPR